MEHIIYTNTSDTLGHAWLRCGCIYTRANPTKYKRTRSASFTKLNLIPFYIFMPEPITIEPKMPISLFLSILEIILVVGWGYDTAGK